MRERVMGCFANARELRDLAATLRPLSAHEVPGVGVYLGDVPGAGALRESGDALGLSLDFETAGACSATDASTAARLARATEVVATRIAEESPTLMLVQGDRVEAAGAAVAGSAAGVFLGHVTCGFPDGAEAATQRQLIAGLARLHFSSDAAWLAEVHARGAPLGTTCRLVEAPEEVGTQIAQALLRFFDDPTQPLDGRGAALEDFVTRALRDVVEISPEAALQILETPGQEGWNFLDVREPDEYAESHLPGARNSPRGFLEVRADRTHYKRDPWFEDRGRKLILYCGGGHRSAMAARTLMEMGFGAVRSLAEGFTGWLERDYPVEPGSA